MSATHLRTKLAGLMVERLDAIEAGLDANQLYMNDLDSEIAAQRAAYVGAAVTEIASLRAALSAPLVG